MTEVSGLNTPPALTAQRGLSQTTSWDSNRDSIRTVPSLPSGQSAHSFISSLPRAFSTTTADVKTSDVISGHEDGAHGENSDTIHFSSKSHAFSISSKKDIEPTGIDCKVKKDIGWTGHQESSTTTHRVFNPGSSTDSYRSESKKKIGPAVHSTNNVSDPHSFEKDEIEKHRTPSMKGSLKGLLSLKRSDHDQTPSRKGSLRELLRKTSRNFKGNAFNGGKSGASGVERKQTSKENHNMKLKRDRVDITTMKRRFSVEWPRARNGQENTAAPFPIVESASEPSSPSSHTSQQVNHSETADCVETGTAVPSVQNELNAVPSEELTKCTLDVEKYLNGLL
ncbi:hypothetical protein BWQ96_08103 [Gracilariopsis chorda]|uniref:Uncharacterized protein n=1 Tax=Gracilariopsis chorda TaxID=448386 RepID=A0A2V3IJH0_9FLOR|nr:hypothetical protein BWQ96_08103 [Gracilariopsis chorda]|eukprot:PXF42183.1 hypothetical protein BWQ96_08103 [Gracilariopsis chorda]